MRKRQSLKDGLNRLLILGAAFSLLAAACSPTISSAQPTDTSAPPVASAAPAPTESPATAPASAQATSTVVAALPSGALRFVLAASGNSAHYTVTEQLASRNFPSDAVGTTSAISGQMVIGSDGKVDSGQSDFKIDLTTLTSDSSGRDGFIQRNTLQTAQFPSAEFVPTDQQGLSVPLPTSGQVSFQLSGNLTIHGVTRPTTWDVTAQLQGNQLTGKATTAFKFEDFGMQPPKAFVVLSVQDNIRLEYDFALALAAPGS
jgi:polyisoprenoid-binding protein YceI